MKIVGKTPSVAEGETARIYRFAPLRRELVARAFPEGSGATVSFFAKAVAGSDIIRVEVQSPRASQTVDHKIGTEWARIEVTIQNDISVRPLEVFLTTRNAVRTQADVAIAFFQVEERLFATSPIAPDIVLPTIASGKGARGAARSADQLSLDLRGTDLTTEAATIMFVAEPLFAPGQLFDAQSATFFSLHADQPAFEISVAARGKRSLLVSTVSRGRTHTEIGTSIILGAFTCFLCLVFDRGMATLILNGAIVSEFEAPRGLVFDRLHVGNSADGQTAFFGYIRKAEIYQTALIYPRVLELYNAACPEHKNRTLAHLLRHFSYPISSKDVAAALGDCFADDGFSFLVNQLNFALPKVYEQFPPGKEFREEDVRDFIWALLQGSPLGRAGRETYSKAGRTDLSLTYVHTTSTDVETLAHAPRSEKLYRVEFKIWGREGYNQVPEQPIKYMLPAERTGAVVMIDRRSTPRIDDLRAIVQKCAPFPCAFTHDAPILQDIPHFISFHEDSRGDRLKTILHIHMSIAA